MSEIENNNFLNEQETVETDDYISKIEEVIDEKFYKNVLKDGFDEDEIPEFAIDEDDEDFNKESKPIYLTEEEQNELAEKYQPLYKSVIASYNIGGGNNDCIDDITSAASLGFTLALKKYDKRLERDGVSQFAAFCRKCMTNQIKTDVVKYTKIKNNTTSLDASVSSKSSSGDSKEMLLSDVLPAINSSTQELCEKKEVLESLKMAIETELTNIERLIICSTYGAFGYQELSQNQISAALVHIGAYQKISQAAISKQKKTIMSKLRVALISKYRVIHY